MTFKLKPLTLGLTYAVSLLVGCADLPTTAMPPTLVPRPNYREYSIVSARGVQIYECKRTSVDSVATGWTFVAPEADLFDRDGRRIGTHGVGPHWLAQDGSRMVGKLVTSVPSPTPGAIAWLLLRAQSEGSNGIFSDVTHIQRLNTQGGIAPTSPCTPQRVGETARVAYTADYRLFTNL
jgi:Protein of unknown function (DUF3455)